MIYPQLNNLGIIDYANTVGQVPAGAMTAALNCVLDQPGIVETRRGFQTVGTQFNDTIHKIFAFQNRLLVHHGTTLSYDSTGSFNWTNYAGTFVPVTGDKIRGTEANSNFYFLTNNGAYKIDSLTNNPYPAGGVAALDLTAATTGSSGFLATPSQTAYRVTWIYLDANNNEIEGNPSESYTVANNGGSAVNVNVTFTVPSNVTTAFSYRIYRTLQTNSLSVAPSDTFQLAAEQVVTSGQIAALSVTFLDLTPDTLLGVTLYTSPGAEGEFQTNDPPPLASDICTYLGMTIYADVSTIQAFFLTLISVGSPSGIQVNDTVSLVGNSTHTYTGANSNNFASQQFAVVTSGTVGQQIDATARNLVSAINQDPSNTEFYAYYTSGFGQLPGQIRVAARNLSHAAFTAVSSRGGAFSPALPSSGTTYISSNNTVLNGFYVSKSNQPEAVPAANLLFAGSGDQPIFRVYPLRNSVAIHSKGGVFQLQGTSPSTLTLQPFDTTVIQRGNDTGVLLDNDVYSFTTQGIIATTGSGTQIASRAVEGDLLTLAAPTTYPNFTSIAFGVGYESDRKYILGIGANPTDTVSTVQYIYNYVTNAFTTWNLSVTCGLVNPFDDRLYFGSSDGYILQERKNKNFTDYADRQFATSIVNASGNVVTLTDISNAVVGDQLVQGLTSTAVTLSSMITAVTPFIAAPPITFDFTAFSNLNSSHISHTIGNFSNRILLVAIGAGDSDGSQAVASVTFNGIAMTAVPNSPFYGPLNLTQIYMFYMVAPPVGTYQVNVTFNPSPNIKNIIGSYSFYNVDQNNPIDSTATGTASTSTASTTITTGTQNCMVVDSVWNGAIGRTFTSTTPGATQDWSVAASLGDSAGSHVGPISGNSQTMSWSIAGATAQWVQFVTALKQVPPTLETVTVANNLAWVGGAALIMQPITSTITYTPATCGYPNFMKAFQPNAAFVFSASNFQTATLTVTSDFDPVPSSVTLTPKFAGGWGTFNWGSIPWGQTNVPLQAVNTLIPRNKLTARWLNLSITVNQVFQNMALNGYLLNYRIAGERMR